MFLRRAADRTSNAIPGKRTGYLLVVIVVHANGNERSIKALDRSCAGLNRFNFAISRSSTRHQRIEQLLRGQRHFFDRPVESVLVRF